MDGIGGAKCQVSSSIKKVPEVLKNMIYKTADRSAMT